MLGNAIQRQSGSENAAFFQRLPQLSLVVVVVVVRFIFHRKATRTKCPIE